MELFSTKTKTQQQQDSTKLMLVGGRDFFVVVSVLVDNDEGRACLARLEVRACLENEQTKNKEKQKNFILLTDTLAFLFNSILKKESKKEFWAPNYSRSKRVVQRSSTNRATRNEK